MKDLIPILLQYVESRQKPGGYVLWVAHNARCFDVPFLLREFTRCGTEIPPNWLFVDTLPLAREVMKSNGQSLFCFIYLDTSCLHVSVPSDATEEVLKTWLLILSTGSKVSSRVSLQALREHYNIPLVGSAHRAMSDVQTLSVILQRLTVDLKLPISGLVERSFSALNTTKPEKKNSS